MTTTPLKIHVTGTASVTRQADRGVLRIFITNTSGSQVTASTTVAARSDALTTLFRQHTSRTYNDDAPITAFTLSAPSTSTHLPPKPQPYPAGLFGSSSAPPPAEKDLVRQYTAQVTAKVVFRDLALLATLAAELSTMDSVCITATEWRLTNAARDAMTREARMGAMLNAVQRADDYAAVVGKEVVACEIEDGGVDVIPPFAQQERMFKGQRLAGGLPLPFGGQMPPQTQAVAQFGPFGADVAQQDGGPSLEPANITVTAGVGVKFVSKDGKKLEA